MTTIKIKSGLEANRGAITPLEGELLYTTDEKKIYIGDGSTTGGVGINADSLDGVDSSLFIQQSVSSNLTTGYTTDVEVLSSDTIAPDMTLESIKTRAVVGNITINFPTGGNGICHIIATIDATNRTITLGANVKSVGTIPDLTAGLVYLITVIRDSATHAIIQVQEVSA